MNDIPIESIETHAMTSDEKLAAYGYGEWVEEPDEVSFNALGYDCLILRAQFLGHLCGYVKIPNDHCMNYENISRFGIAVHGGLTFYGTDYSRDYWIGFDCAHGCDIVPGTPALREYLKDFPDAVRLKPRYKNVQFCINECVRLCRQLEEIKIKVFVRNGIDEIRDFEKEKNET